MMPSTVSPSSSSPENRCPDCLGMELTVNPNETVKKGRFNRKKPDNNPESLELYLTINFNEQWEYLLGGRVKFGLRGGELRLILQNGTISLNARELHTTLELTIQKERSQQTSQESKIGIEASLGEKSTLKGTAEDKTTAATSDKFTFTSAQVSTKGDKGNPAWVFEIATGESVLKGLLKNAKLATLTVTGQPCEVVATFEVSLRDVRITDGEGAWLVNLVLASVSLYLCG